MDLNSRTSAFSDDEHFSTRARRGLGASDTDYHVIQEQPAQRMNRGDGDGMGLSTHVETSDRGSRRHARATNDERIDGIDEVDDESGRTSPQGTIGEVHDYMSEHITSNLINR